MKPISTFYSFTFHSKSMGRFFHFTNENTQAQRDEVIFPIPKGRKWQI